jgi:hypothetical protein
MYYFDKNHFGYYNLSEANNFINFWSQFYKYSIKKLNSNDKIDYLKDLNLNTNLTEENIINLLRWKYPKYLTSIILSGPNLGHSNDKE